MGYTHYYRGPVVLSPTVLVQVKAIIKVARGQDIHIRGGSGTGRPTVTANEIRLNGNAVEDLDYETFMVTPEGKRSFCKTARRPYDAVVGAILILLSETNVDFTVSSDGGWDGDWRLARRLYADAFGKAPETSPFKA